jgi:ethanolamine ammonia-lyase small subunit
MIDQPPRAYDEGPTADLLRAIRHRTPARIVAGRAGASYTTATQIELRRDHAAALDAVRAEIDPERDFGAGFVADWGLFEVRSRARSKSEFLHRPDLGRRLEDEALRSIAERCPKGSDLQVVLGDGLSAAALAAQTPLLLPRLAGGAARLGWSFSRPFFVRYCRVGVLNDVGETLDPAVVVLLIGERPGLATAESLSAYLAYRPRAGHNDARRNLISNIHPRGVPVEAAAERILRLAETLRRAEASGVGIKEEWDGSALPDGLPSRPPG